MDTPVRITSIGPASLGADLRKSIIPSGKLRLDLSDAVRFSSSDWLGNFPLCNK